MSCSFSALKVFGQGTDTGRGEVVVLEHRMAGGL